MAAQITAEQWQQLQQHIAQQNQRIQRLQERPRPTILKPRTFGNTEAEDWITFRRHFENVVDANGWDGQIACLALSASMTGAAATAVHDFQANIQDNHNVLLDDYEARFLPASASEMARVRFDNATQGRKETLLNWHSRLRNLFRRAYPQAGDETPLIRRFELGLKNSILREHVLRQHPATYAAALEASQNEQSIVEVTTALHLGPREEPMEIGALSDMTCHFCDKKGHIRRDCRAFSRAREQLGLSTSSGRTASRKKSSSSPLSTPPASWPLTHA